MIRRRHGERGQGLAEFALVAPILFLLLFGVIQLGLIMAAQNGLVNGVRDATRKAATYRVNDLSFDAGSIGSICTAVGNQLTSDLSASIPGFTAANLVYSIAYEAQSDPGGWFIVAHISATYDNPIYVPLVGNVIHPSDPATLPLDASEQMRVENPELTSAASGSCP
jgi:Flp pilus assembly protein TadG